MNDVELLALCSFLHDVGKLVFRAGRKGERHYEETYNILREFLPEDIAEIASHHHESKITPLEWKPSALSGEKKILAEIISQADNISSALEREDEEKGTSRKMVNIFSTLRNGKRREIDYSKEDIENFLQTLKVLFSSMKAEEVPLGFLDVISRTFLINIPETTMSGPVETSLYSHQKLTAAFAVAIYHYLLEKYEDLRNFPFGKVSENEKCFLLLEIDISGIQKFLYHVGMKKALRFLMGRSFFISLLAPLIKEDLIRGLHVTDFNFLVTSGGFILSVLPNTQSVKDTLRKILDRYSRSLFFLTDGNLLLHSASVEFSPSDTKNFKKVSEDLMKRMERSKQLPFRDQFEEMFNYNEDESEICDLCGFNEMRMNLFRKRWDTLVIDGKKYRLCELCSFMNDVLEKLGKGKVYLSRNEEWNVGRGDILIYVKSIEDLLNENPKDLLSGIRSFHHIPYELGYESKEFDVIAKSGPGAPFLAYMAMDMDDVGKLIEELMNEKPSLSRFAEFSIRLDIFFRNEVSKIVKSDIEEPKRLWNRIEKKPDKFILYVGGDDLIVVGHFSAIIPLAFKIEEKFKEFFANENITISSGISIVPRNYPVRIAVERAQDNLELSKRNRKGKITVFKRTFNFSNDFWKILDLFSEHINLGGETLFLFNVNDPEKNSLIRRTTLWKILWILSQKAERAQEKVKKIVMLRYTISRIFEGIVRSAKEEERERLYKWCKELPRFLVGKIHPDLVLSTLEYLELLSRKEERE